MADPASCRLCGFRAFVKTEKGSSEVSMKVTAERIPEAQIVLEIEIDENQHRRLLNFYDKTKGDGYDWIGMLLSQFTPFHVKRIGRWYCSEWIAYALRLICSIEGLHKVSDMSPGALANLLPKEQKIRLVDRPVMSN